MYENNVFNEFFVYLAFFSTKTAWFNTYLVSHDRINTKKLFDTNGL